MSDPDYVSPVQLPEGKHFVTGTARDPKVFKEVVKSYANHVQRTFEKGANDVADAILSMKHPEIDVPKIDDAARGLSGIEEKIWYEDYKVKSARKRDYELALPKAFADLEQLCPPTLKAKLEGARTWDVVRASKCPLQLLYLLQGICCKFEADRHPVWALTEAKKRVAIHIQGKDQTLPSYYEELMAHIKVVEAYGGGYGKEPRLLNLALEQAGVEQVGEEERWFTATAEQLKAASKVVRGWVLSKMVLSKAHHGRHRKLILKLINDYILGTNNYPTTPEQALSSSRSNGLSPSNRGPRTTA